MRDGPEGTAITQKCLTVLDPSNKTYRVALWRAGKGLPMLKTLQLILRATRCWRGGA